LDVVGGTTCTTGTNENVHTGSTAITDPFASVSAPTFPANACSTCSATYPSYCTNGSWKVFGTNTNLVSGSKTLDPGIYCHGINVGTSTATMNAGTYVIYGCGGSCAGGNAFNASSGSASVTGSGVTIYNSGV